MAVGRDKRVASQQNGRLEDFKGKLYLSSFGLVYRRGLAQEANWRYGMLARCGRSECENIPKLAWCGASDGSYRETGCG